MIYNVLYKDLVYSYEITSEIAPDHLREKLTQKPLDWISEVRQLHT